MLTSDQLDTLVDPIVALYEAFQDSVIQDIARRLVGMNFARSTAAWQMQRLVESGKVYEKILEELAQLTGRSETELRKMFNKAGVKAMKFDDAIYRAAGLNPLPLNLSPAMAQVLAAGLRKTNGLVKNLTMTTALSGQNAFLDAADLAYMQVSAGAMSYQQAVREGVKKLAAQGLNVIQFPGRQDQLDVAMRRAVLTGVNQTAGNLQIARADEMGVDLVQTSAHIGARNTGVGPANHEGWQGRIFSRSGTHKRYPNFVEKTGYGTGPGLMGWNCRHSFYPFFEGISENAYSRAELDSYASKKVKYNGEEMSFYDATQKQRGIERKIRYWKRQKGALDAAGLDSSAETTKVREWQARMRDFTKQTGLVRQGERERIIVEKKTVGFSFLSSDTHLTSITQAREIGAATDGWLKHERIFKNEYLKRFKLRDDIERTFGFWGGPEPSFNAYVRGKQANVIEMAKAWAQKYKQQGMALLFPNPTGMGGKLIWKFGRRLSDSELDSFFTNLDDWNKRLGGKFKDYFGVTVKGLRNIEFWYKNPENMDNALYLIDMAMKDTKLPAIFSREGGYDFILLKQGEDY